MTYWSTTFLVAFLPLTIIIYNIMPQKHRWKVLLLASYLFFFLVSKKLIIYIIATTLLMYFGGLWLAKLQSRRDEELKDVEKEKKKEIKDKYLKKQRWILTIVSLVILGILIVLKYSGFICENLDALFKAINVPINIPIPKFMLPIGISFYTLQAISYLIDVYKEKIKADKNLGRVALFISFFPQIMEGPICRYSQTADDLWKCERTNYQRLTFGLQRILFGLMKKTIVADRLNAFIIEAFDNYANYNGTVAMIAMVFYTLQLYMDFSGTMDIALGIGDIFGVKLPENFKQPFFSKSISDFWTRWHITLGTWFRDYIFYPVSLTGFCKKITTAARKKIGNYYGPLIASIIALFCVWICNGLWHGAAWTYIFFGMYHFCLIILGRIFEPLIKKINTKLHINNKNFLYKGMQIIRTTCLVFIGELFFRANTLTDGMQMFGKMFTDFSFGTLTDGTILKMNLDIQDIIIVAVVVIAIFIIGLIKEKGTDIREAISKKNIFIRWTLYYALILAIILFGTYGLGYVPVDPMYANF